MDRILLALILDGMVDNNEMQMMNSMKMKLSVLFGVIQMILGLCLRI